MLSTRLFRDQHEELSRLMEELRAQLRQGAPGEAAFTAFQAFARKLHAHLDQEDHGIYPKMLVHENEHVRLTAQIYQAEMGSLGQDFETLERRWDSPGRLEEDPAAFAGELELLLARLGHRMSREDRGLYSLLDRLE